MSGDTGGREGGRRWAGAYTIPRGEAVRDLTAISVTNRWKYF